MLQNDPHNATKKTESLNCFVLDFCWVCHNFSSSAGQPAESEVSLDGLLTGWARNEQRWIKANT